MKQYESSMMTSGDIIAGVAAIDYLTMTTWSNERYYYWQDEYFSKASFIDGKHDSKFEQYAGIKVNYGMGSAFVGEGQQKQKNHYLLYLTSALAEHWHKTVIDDADIIETKHGQDMPNCSRIDLQITVPYPSDWSQMELVNRLNDSGRLVQTRASNGKVKGRNGSYARVMRTVYIGADGADKLIRIYDKVDENGELFLRFEVQYRNAHLEGRAFKTFYEVIRDHEMIARILVDEINLTGDKQLERLFVPVLHDVRPYRIKTSRRKSTATREWLMTTVLNSLARHLDENADNEVESAFLRVLMGDNIDMD